MIYLADKEQEGRRTGVKEISRAIDSPVAFTAKILQQLTKSNLLLSYKGPTGGFVLPSHETIKLIDIIKAIDGDKLIEACVLGFEGCSDANPCPVHDKYRSIRQQLKESLFAIDIRDPQLARQRFAI